MTDRNEVARRALAAKTIAAAIKEIGDDSTNQLLKLMTTAGDLKIQVTGNDGANFGTYGIVPGKQSAAVTNQAQFLAWVKEHHPDEIEPMVRPAFQKKILDRAAKIGDAVDDDGVRVEGVTVRSGDPHLMCLASDLAKERAAMLVHGGGLPALLAGPVEQPAGGSADLGVASG